MTSDEPHYLLPAYKLSYAGARRLADLAREAAARRNVPGAIAIVDDGANLILAERWDHTMISALSIAIEKAMTAVSFQRPTLQIEDQILEGRIPMLSPARNIAYSPLQGGHPIRIKNHLIGGIAIGGTMNAVLDEEIIVEVIEQFQNITTLAPVQ